MRLSTVILSIALVFIAGICIAQKTFKEKIDSLDAKLKTEKVDTNKAGQLIAIARFCYMDQQPEKGDMHRLLAKKFISGSKKKTMELAFLYHMVAVGCSRNSQYDMALQYQDTVINLRKSVNYTKGVVDGINQAGIYYWCKGSYPAALDQYMKALKMNETLKDTALMLNIYNNIGIVYYNLEKFDLSIEYYTNVLTHLDTNKHVFLRANALDNIGLVYMKLNEYSKALNFHLNAMRVKKKLNDERYMSTSFLNCANAYSALNNKSEAINFYNKAIAIKEKVNDVSGLAHCYNDLSEIFMQKKNYISAKINLLKGYDYAKRSDSDELMKELTKSLSYCYEMLGDHKTALFFQKEFMNYKDSIFNESNNKTMLELESKYQNKQKEIENTVLKQKNVIQSLESEKKDNDIKKQRAAIWLVSLGLLLILGLAVVTFKNYKASQRANILIAAQKLQVEEQKNLVDEKQKEIIDSINYAKRIQTTLLAHTDFLNENIPSNFVLFKPKDIVSGDFYWAAKKGPLFYLAACDSTGHGVPGAFMSLLSIGFLSEAINEKNILEPNLVFNYVRDRLIGTISKEGQQDGFDGILLCIDQKNKKLTYSAANNAPIVVSNGEIVTLEADKMPVGKGINESSFRLFNITLMPNDSLYIYTDGYADQFGGPKGKKFLYKKMNQLIASVSPLPLEEQKAKLEVEFDAWKGELEQVDDVLLIGIKI